MLPSYKATIIYVITGESILSSKEVSAFGHSGRLSPAWLFPCKVVDSPRKQTLLLILGARGWSLAAESSEALRDQHRVDTFEWKGSLCDSGSAC